jgi:ATP-dependent Lon protease
LPKELTEHGMSPGEIRFPDAILLKIIREFTKEAGVRNLEREISSIIRKIAKEKVIKNKIKKSTRIIVTNKLVEQYLGVKKYYSKKRSKEEKNKIGSVYGLAWTSMGGDILNIDVTIMNGQNKLTLTGQLGDVMKESALAGLSFLRSNAELFGIPPDYFKDREIHIHLPEGAIPKDGPSAGITMIIAMLSAITKNPVKSNVAMTGEITLRGHILPIGGLNEKLLAAKRNNITTILIPEENRKDISEVPVEIKSGLNIILIKHVSDAIKYAFVKPEVKFIK